MIDVCKLLRKKNIIHLNCVYLKVRITSQELLPLRRQYTGHVEQTKRIEYILEENLLEKSVKRPFCCTVSILQVYFTYICYITFWALEYHFIENLKLMLKENQIMK